MPEGVTIERAAFQMCSSLKRVIIPSGASIEDALLDSGVFSYCTSLENVIISDEVKARVSRAFYHCSSLKTITIPKSVTEIGSEAFRYTDLTTAYFEVTSGWNRRNFYTTTTSIKSSDLADPKKAASKLKEAYNEANGYLWERNS